MNTPAATAQPALKFGERGARWSWMNSYAQPYFINYCTIYRMNSVFDFPYVPRIEHVGKQLVNDAHQNQPELQQVNNMSNVGDIVLS